MNNLALLGVIQTVTNADSRAHGAGAVRKTRNALIEAFKIVDPPKFEQWLDAAVTEAAGAYNQVVVIGQSLLTNTVPPSTVPERAAQVAADREVPRLIIPTSDKAIEPKPAA